MSYNPGQLRGPDGKWISTGARRVSRKARSKANRKAYAGRRATGRRKPFKIDKAAARQERGVGLSGLKKNTIPYARVSKKSATIGVNTGAFIPGTNKRIVLGNYARFETVNKKTAVDRAIGRVGSKLIPKGTKRDLIGQHIRKNVKLDNPAVRYSTPGSASRNGTEFRLGTSRKAGPTLIARRGQHKRTKAESKSGIKAYNKRMNTLAGKRVAKPRPTRRRQAAARKNRRKRNG